ncbi:hypothetical protein Dda_7936 [Drechslerella dactyloides]|uniref:glutamine--tRNA ligase n=1 Tax=Drechslerella dactyloides TaxID=74499 RepID=A0AAD6IVA3_DREDA|nr:hypothetical protein Dda_7936 [Drechslerella dactyloides]
MAGKEAKESKKPAVDAPSSSKAAAAAAEPDPLNSTSMFEEGFLGSLHKPGGNPQIKPELRDAHLKVTGGKVFTRFPPEPNGYLHIGHSKAIAVNFGYARFHGGECYLRYDDTNPEAEEEKYFTSIREIIEWLGFKPYKITHSSDHFQRLYDLAEDLIKRDKGYVCHCTAEDIQKQRGGKEGEAGPRYGCAHRDRPIEESLAEFRNMRDGKYKPKEALLRMKQDMTSGNPQMWDLTAYRVLDADHHRTGAEWKIYPTYDFTHCLCDSFENITHSLCTTEFITARESYDWLCDALELYKPRQSEYGRLNLTGTIMSKRKIAKLVNEGHVRGWDDPRLYTLVAVRRRGVPPGAVLSFINELGVTTATTHIMTARFEQSVRRYLEQTVPRLSLILDPVLVVLENLPEDHYEEISVPFKPNDAAMGEHKVPFTNKFYIDRSDFREVDSKDYFRMAPGKSVGLLRVPHTVRVTGFKKDETTGKVTEIHARYENDVTFKKPKTYLQWIAHAPEKGSPVAVEARLFNQLFTSENPESNPAGFLADINPNSEEIYGGAIIDTGFHEVRRRAPWPAREGEGSAAAAKEERPESVRFQGLRVGYFAMDSDSAGERIVLNRIVTLKEDPEILPVHYVTFRRTAAMSNYFGKLNKSQLADYARPLGINPQLKKQDLIDQIEQAAASQRASLAHDPLFQDYFETLPDSPNAVAVVPTPKSVRRRVRYSKAPEYKDPRRSLALVYLSLSLTCRRDEETGDQSSEPPTETIITPPKKSRASTGTRSARKSTSLRVTEHVVVPVTVSDAPAIEPEPAHPLSPGQLARSIPVKNFSLAHIGEAVNSWFTAAAQTTGFWEHVDYTRETLSSPNTIQAIIATYELAWLCHALIPWQAVSIPIPAAKLPYVDANTGPTTVRIPDLFILLSWQDFWAPIVYWFTLGVTFPMFTSYFINIRKRGTYDPLSFSISKALIAYLVYTKQIIHPELPNLFTPDTAALVAGIIGDETPLIGAAIGGLLTFWEAILSRR